MLETFGLRLSYEMLTSNQQKRAEMEEAGVMPDEHSLDDPRVHRIWKKRLELLFGSLAPTGLILDAGCGPGTSGIVLAELGGTVIGIDISSRAVAVANERAATKRVNFSAVLGDLDNLPARNESFDICYSGWVLHHFPDIRPALSELALVLKPGGKIFIMEPNESNPSVRLSRLIEGMAERWILRAGWDTPNRSTHLSTDYVAALEELGFADIQIGSCSGGDGSPLPIEHDGRGPSAVIAVALRLAFHMRTLCFNMTEKILRPPLNGSDLLISATLRDNT